MNLYTVVLFLHVTGTVTYFVGIGIALFGLFALRGAQRTEQVRTLAQFVATSGRVMGAGVLLILVTGLYMAFATWGGLAGWMVVALVSLVLLAPLGTILIEPRRRAIAALSQQTPDGPVPPALRQRTHDPVMLTATQTVVAVLLGIVFLMTNKPSLVSSIVVMLVALLLGVTSGLFATRRGGKRPQRGESANVAESRVQQPIA